MDVDITVLCDNIVNTKGLLGEHGLSILLEKEGQQILFDVGQGVSALHNSRVLGATLRSPPIILSHGHYDHTGGLKTFLNTFPQQVIFAHPDIFTKRYSTTQASSQQNIGIPFSKEDLEREGARIYLCSHPHEVRKGIWMTGQIARPFAADQSIDGLSLDSEGTVTDNVRDEVAVIVEGSSKTLLLLGCAHAGVLNTIQRAEALTEKPLYGIVGGLHLMHAHQSKVRALAEVLQERDVELVLASHCSGCKAAEVLSNYVECKLTAVGAHIQLRF